MTKGSLKTKNFSLVITKNLNWEILTKNLVIFKRWDGVKGVKVYYYGGSLKNPIFGGGLRKSNTWGGNCLKRGAWTVFRFKRGGLAKKEVVFLRGGGYPNAYYGFHTCVSCDVKMT